jgi:hypothetical protein
MDSLLALQARCRRAGSVNARTAEAKGQVNSADEQRPTRGRLNDWTVLEKVTEALWRLEFISGWAIILLRDNICRVPKTTGTHNQRLKKTKRYPQTRRAKTADETPRLRSDSYEARSTERLDYVPTRTRHARQDVSTTFRLVRGILDGTPRPRSDSHEARSTRLLDYREISDSHDPGSDRSTHLVHQLWDKSQSI